MTADGFYQHATRTEKLHYAIGGTCRVSVPVTEYRDEDGNWHTLPLHFPGQDAKHIVTRPCLWALILPGDRVLDQDGNPLTVQHVGPWGVETVSEEVTPDATVVWGPPSTRILTLDLDRTHENPRRQHPDLTP